jgi:adenylylsulfate kinase
MKPDKKRHILKTITWRFLATLITFLLAWIIGGDITVAMHIGAWEVFIKMLAYYYHERFWFKYIRFRKKIKKPKNVFHQNFKVDRKEKEKSYHQESKVLWFTGLSGSGKSAIANATEQLLHAKGYKTYILDGDNVRWGLNSDLTFSKKDREENIRRVAEVAKLFADSGTIVITSFISPYHSTREMAKEIIGKDDYIEVFVDTSIKTCERRDIKGLYKKAREGKIKDFTGVNDPYDKPINPDVVVDGNEDGDDNIVKCANEIFENIKDKI